MFSKHPEELQVNNTPQDFLETPLAPTSRALGDLFALKLKI